MKLTHASLFSGIGGFDLAAEWAGFENVFQCEKDEFCTKLLRQNFKNVKLYGDIYELDAREHNGRIDVISGGFPCQPFSVAGKRKGSSDDRYLWDEMFRIITEVAPKWVIAENVPGLLTIESGLVLEKCYTDLESQGYEVQAFIIPAISKGAPHRRDRLWIIANADGVRSNRRGIHRNCEYRERTIRENIKYDRAEIRGEVNTLHNAFEHIADTESFCLQGFDTRQGEMQYRGSGWSRNWYEVATEFCRVDDGLPNRVDRIKALGNAIVPQVAYEIFKAIKETEEINGRQSTKTSINYVQIAE